jgi:hypothetical protein
MYAFACILPFVYTFTLSRFHGSSCGEHVVELRLPQKIIIEPDSELLQRLFESGKAFFSH